MLYNAGNMLKINLSVCQTTSQDVCGQFTQINDSSDITFGMPLMTSQHRQIVPNRLAIILIILITYFLIKISKWVFIGRLQPLHCNKRYSRPLRGGRSSSSSLLYLLDGPASEKIRKEINCKCLIVRSYL